MISQIIGQPKGTRYVQFKLSGAGSLPHAYFQKERNWFVEKLQGLAQAKHVRITFLSGDVHCAAVGYFKTLVRGKGNEIDPSVDPRYMLNVCSPVSIIYNLLILPLGRI